MKHLGWYTCTSEEKVGAGQRVAAAYSEETLNKEKTPNLIVFNHVVFILRYDCCAIGITELTL